METRTGRPPGRPRGSRNKYRRYDATHYFAMRISERDLEQLHAVARADGVSRSVFARQALRQALATRALGDTLKQTGAGQ